MSLTNKSLPGRVYIASMNLRGRRAIAPEGASVLNVTSAQRKASSERRDFSPMTHKDGGYKGYWNFEAYWQSGKVFDGIPRSESLTWWKNVTEPKRRFPKAKGKHVLYAIFDDVSSEPMDYVTSRKRVYVPQYYSYMKDSESAHAWKKKVSSGRDVIVYDFDGPRTSNGDVDVEEVTRELIFKKLHETQSPFGHGYIVAAHLTGLADLLLSL